LKRAGFVRWRESPMSCVVTPSTLLLEDSSNPAARVHLHAQRLRLLRQIRREPT
jgi:hypothetical protein